MLEEGYEKGLEDGQASGRSEGKAEYILYLLERLGTIPDDIRESIVSTTDTKILDEWFGLAARADSIEAFIQDMTATRK